jgi:hypothetical protein
MVKMFHLAASASTASAGEFDFSDRRYVASRLIRRAILAIRAARRPETVATLALLSEPANQSRMVFIVGAARSGTTAMQRALNASPEVFVLDEAYLFWENLRPGFRTRYNATHRAWDRPVDKDNDCPAVAPEGSTWVETIAALAAQHRFVGEKIAITSYNAGRWPSELLAFHRHHFHGAAYILTFRNPRDAILSPRFNWGIRDLVPWARSYIAAQRALIRLRANFPRTVPVILEKIDADTFQAVEECLDCPMPQLPSVLVRKAESARDPERVPPELQETVDNLEALYPTLCDAVSAFGSAHCGAPFDAIDARLSELYRRLDPLYYSIEARLARLRSKAVTASRMARNVFVHAAYR